MNLLNDKNHYYFQKTEYYSLLKNRYLGLFVFLCWQMYIINHIALLIGYLSERHYLFLEE